MKGNRNAAKGSYYKQRTKKWLIAQGYQVADLEVIRWIHKPGGQRIPVKRDQFGADLFAMNTERAMVVQVKGGKAAGIGHFPAALRAFQAYTFPKCIGQWIIAWPTRARQPRIVVVP